MKHRRLEITGYGRRYTCSAIAVWLALTIVLLLLPVDDVFAQAPPSPTDMVPPPASGSHAPAAPGYADAFAPLALLALIAILLESAFATIFNWRVFLAYFSVKGIKTIVMVAVSYIVVHYLNLDLLWSIVASLKTPKGPEISPNPVLTGGLTALILAGGSSAVFEVMRGLGLRVEREVEPKIAKPKEEAWVSIKVRRDRAEGDIRVFVTPIVPQPAPDILPAPLAGTIAPGRPRLSDLLLRNPNRFPRSEGYRVVPGTAYRIEIVGRDANGETLRALGEDIHVFAPGAIVDFHVNL